MEFDETIAKKTSAKGIYLSFDDVVITYSSQYQNTSPDLKHLLNPDRTLGTGQGWNSGTHPPAWIKLTLKEPVFIEEAELMVNISPDCEVTYQCEMEVETERDFTRRRIVDETTQEMHWAKKIIKVKVQQRIRSFMVKTTGSKSWVAWSRILLMR